MAVTKTINAVKLTTEFVQNNVQFTDVKEGIELIVRALSPGTFTGIDQNTITYLPNVIERDMVNLAGQQVKWMHTNNTLLVIGYVKGVGLQNGTAFAKLIITHPAAVAEIKAKLALKERISVSIEALVHPNDKQEAEHIYPTAIALLFGTSSGACPDCHAISARPITLESLSSCACPGMSDAEKVALAGHMEDDCMTKMKADYPNESEEQLKARCADGQKKPADTSSGFPDSLVKAKLAGIESTGQLGSLLAQDRQRENKMTNEIPKQIQKAMVLLGTDDLHKAYEIASIFGYPNSTAAIAARLSNGTLAPATQADAIEMVESANKATVALEAEKSALSGKIVELEKSSTAVVTERDAMKVELEAIKQVEIDSKKVVLEKLIVDLKKVDEKGVFLDSIKDLAVDKQISLSTAFIEKFSQIGSDSTNVKLSRDNAGGANDAIVNAAAKELFGQDIDHIVNKMTGKTGGAS